MPGAGSETPGSSRSRSRIWPAGRDDDHAAAFATFRRTCRALADGARRCARRCRRTAASCAVCRRGARDAGTAGALEARAFFEAHFRPFDGRAAVRPRLPDRLLRARIRGLAHARPRASRRRFSPGPTISSPFRRARRLPGLDPGLQAARRTPAGLRALSRPRRHRGRRAGGAGQADRLSARPGEAFIAHVQGSARIRLRGRLA